MGKESRGRCWAGEDMSEVSAREGGRWEGGVGREAGEQMKEKSLIPRQVTSCYTKGRTHLLGEFHKLHEECRISGVYRKPFSVFVFSQ